MTVTIPSAFSTYLDAAILRLRGQFPDIDFSVCEAGILVGPCVDDRRVTLSRAVLNAVYREKIYAETLAMRTALFAAVMR